MFDYLIIGAGIIGSFITAKLAQYNVRILVIDKENDIASGTTKANSAIIHSGYDPKPGTLKAKLNAKGNRMYPALCKYYDIAFNPVGSLTVAFSEAEVVELKKLLLRAEENNVEVRLIGQSELREMEPELKETAQMAILAPTAGIVYPWEMAMALMDHGISNGVVFEKNREVKSISRAGGHYVVDCGDKSFKAKNIINAAGVFCGKIAEMVGDTEYKIKPRRGEYFVLSRGKNTFVNHVIFPMPSEKGKGVLCVPISERELLLGPTSDFSEDFDDLSTTESGLLEVKREAAKMFKNLPMERCFRSFAGLRASSEKGDFIIEESPKNAGLFHLIGIESPGLASAPAIAEYLAKIAGFDKVELKPDFKEYEKTTRIRNMQMSERIEEAKTNPEFGEIVCRCEEISLAEVKEAIHGNVGSDTVCGVKRRVRVGAGKCQGGFCEPEIVKIIAEEKGISPLEVLYEKEGSNILLSKAKEVVV